MQSIQPVTATAIETSTKGLCLFVANRRIQIPWEKCSRRLALATECERLNAELTPGGYGIHWPSIDEDLSIAGLMRDLE